MPSPVENLIYDADRYYQSAYGVLLPKSLDFKESGATGKAVSPFVQEPQSLEAYLKAQLMQSRRKQFLFHQIYRRDVWVRSVIDFVVRRGTRDPNQLIDRIDPSNPDVRDLQDFIENCNDDFDFEDLYRMWFQDLL